MNYNISASSFRGFGYLSTVTDSRARSMEKLSSGYRVNTASDDSARSAMSSIMRAQIRGLDQATRNSDHAINLLNSAESGLSEITSILQRIRELSVHAASDVNTPEDKQASQDEVEQLLDEIDRIAKSTEYNKIKLLNNEGNAENTKKGLAAVVGIQNITPDGKLSEKPMIWDMMDPSTGGFGDSTIHNGVLLKPVYSQLTEYRTPTSAEQKNIYNDFQYSNGTIYAGDLYDAAGNKLGSVAAGGQATVDSPTNAILPENKQTVTPPSPYTQESDCAEGDWVAPGTTTPSAPYSKKTYGNSASTPASSSNVYGKDASGNLVQLSYQKRTETTESGTRYSEYSNKEFNLRGAHIDFKNLNQPGGFILADLYGTGFNSSCNTCHKHYSVKFQSNADLQIPPIYPAGSTSPEVIDLGNAGRLISFEMADSTGHKDKHQTFEMNIDAVPANATGEDFAKYIVDTINASHDSLTAAGYTYDKIPFFTHYNQYAASGSKLYTFDYRKNQTNNSNGYDTFSAISFGEVLDDAPTSPIPLKIQAGANANEVVNIFLPFISVKDMGIADVDLTSSSSASDAITLMDNALDFISLERTKIGSYRNRLEHVSFVDETSALATTDSESKVRDTDMSSEIINFTKAQVLEEYGVNSVAEINKMIANVMEFIQ